MSCSSEARFARQQPLISCLADQHKWSHNSSAPYLLDGGGIIAKFNTQDAVFGWYMYLCHTFPLTGTSQSEVTDEPQHQASLPVTIQPPKLTFTLVRLWIIMNLNRPYMPLQPP